MGRCNFCGTDEAMPFRCKYCDGVFCTAHRLPENHECNNINNAKQTQNARKISYSPSEKYEPVSKKESSKIIFYVALILCVLSLGLSWHYSQIQGYSTGYDVGISEGEKDGIKIGYQAGYIEGIETGKTNGAVEGYEIGYENGMYIGKEIGYQEGTSFGYNLGYDEGNNTGFETRYSLGLLDISNRAFNLSEPTYAEVVSFLRRDQTNKQNYLLGSFNCDDYSRTVKTNAFLNGIHCYYVSIDFIEPPGHAIVAFNTSDKGLVFFEPQSDEEMIVEIGIRYWKDNGDYRTKHDDTIVDFELVW